jgi:hypothetical protein
MHQRAAGGFEVVMPEAANVSGAALDDAGNQGQQPAQGQPAPGKRFGRTVAKRMDDQREREGSRAHTNGGREAGNGVQAQAYAAKLWPSR